MSAEVRFAPELHEHRALSLEDVVEAVTAGFRRGEDDAHAAGQPIVVNAISCAMRTPDLELISGALAHGAHRIGHGVRLRSDTSLTNPDHSPDDLLLGPESTSATTPTTD